MVTDGCGWVVSGAHECLYVGTCVCVCMSVCVCVRVRVCVCVTLCPPGVTLNRIVTQNIALVSHWIVLWASTTLLSILSLEGVSTTTSLPLPGSSGFGGGPPPSGPAAAAPSACGCAAGSAGLAAAAAATAASAAAAGLPDAVLVASVGPWGAPSGRATG